MIVQCRREGHVWDAAPQAYKLSTWIAKIHGYEHPVSTIDCPVCARRYFKTIDGRWFADRELRLLEPNEEAVAQLSIALKDAMAASILATLKKYNVHPMDVNGALLERLELIACAVARVATGSAQ